MGTCIQKEATVPTSIEVEVFFDKVLAVPTNASEIVAPVESIAIGGYQYTIDQNGVFTPGDLINGNSPKYWVDIDGYRWEVSSDDTAALVKVRGDQVGGPRTFVLMRNGNFIYAVGIDTTGGFEPKDL